ncbi:helix-turn-helix domain-containing protein [Antarcticirhabdus aurantiaca]|uniref:helix-turn-helix domain-containing protein n=1 Tax=Antarcticirhabdus aurantiaca TaxID=2606717 RepID=UPI00131E63AA|nr:helix-turn-helix domain-containing protein [Antarcticirhabdus aurantiaca]
MGALVSDWGKVPREVFMDKRLTRLDIQVLGILCAHANGRTGICTRRQEAIAAEVDAKRESVNRSLKKLGNLGYVQARARAGMKRSLEYRVLINEGAPGQLGLFDAHEAPRAAKAKASARAAIRDRQITSDVTPDVTSVVTSDITSNEQTPVNRSCAAAPAAPANDDRPAEVIEEAGAVPLRRPPQPAEPAGQVPSWTRAQTDALGARLRDAAGASINSASPGFLVLAEPIGWLAAGCDLELDVLPAVAGLAARSRGSPIRSWSYFAGAVREARDRRIEMAKPAGTGSPTDPRSTARGGDYHAQRSRGPSGHRAGSGRRNHADELDAAFDDAFAALLGPVDAG